MDRIPNGLAVTLVLLGGVSSENSVVVSLGLTQSTERQERVRALFSEFGLEVKESGWL